jgi:hypothetical protein
MATPLGRARTVALSYALLGAMYLAMIGILSFAIWVGSWRLLWHDLVDMPNSLTKTVAPLVVANAVMAALAFCYLRLNQLFRVITLIASLIILLLPSLVLSQFSRTGLQSKRRCPSPGLIVAKSPLALGYCLCTYSLWKIGGLTPNNRRTGS